MGSKPQQQRYMTSAVQMVYRKLGSRAVVGPLLQRHYEALFAANREQNLFRGVYDSFEAAQASAPPSRPVGYDNPAPAKMYRDRFERVFTNDYPMMLWLERALRAAGSAPRVFDFGGHVGFARYTFARYLRFPPGLRWQVCDVPAVVAEGEAIAREQGMAGLSFTTDRAQADGADVFFASGSLQYVPTPLAELLGALKQPPPHLLLNMLSLHPTRSAVTLQSIGTVFCPYAIFQRDAFVQSLAPLGYRLVDSWDNPDKGCTIPFHPEVSVSGYTGLYLSRVAPGAAAA
jgi:putative methyltransferase (TIGR04325 family)